MISVEFRDWVNEKVIEHLPNERVRSGDKIMVRCPLCGDSKKNSMKKRGYYYLKDASYHCFNCGEHMSGMKLLERLCGSDYSELREEYIRKVYDGKHFGMSSSSGPGFKKENNSVLFNLKTVIKPEWKKPLSENARNYLSNRKVLEAPFLKDDLFSYYTKNKDEYILIPWKMNNVECYFQLNDFEKRSKLGMKYIFPKNMDKMIYGLDNINLKYDFIILTEGVYDSLFIPNCCAIGGRFLTDLQYSIIKKRYPKMTLCYSFDNDGPGLESMAKIVNDRNCRNDIKFFKWFSDDTKEKDINDYILKKGNVNLFTDENVVRSCIVDPVIMKMWLMRKGLSR